MLFGIGAVFLALSAHSIGLSNNPTFGWKKVLLTLTGVSLFFFAGLSKWLKTKLLPAIISYVGFLIIAFALTTHRLHLWHRLELRWIKALLIMFGASLLILGFQFFRATKSDKPLRFGLGCLGIFALVVAVFSGKFGLSESADFVTYRLLMALSGLAAVIVAGLFPQSVSVGRRAIVWWRSLPIRFKNITVLLSLPWILFWLNPNWPFQGFEGTDPWYYFGHFIHFPHYARMMPTYANERFMWILPGYILVHLFSPVYGVLALHVLFYSVSVLSVYYLIDRFTEAHTALLTASLFACHPLFIVANSWCYLDGATIAYSLLTLVFIVQIQSSRFPRLCTALAGVWWASLIYTYILWSALTPCFLYFHYKLSSQIPARSFLERAWKTIVPFATWFGLGAMGLTVFLQGLHIALFADWRFFFKNNMAFAISVSNLQTNPWSSGNYQWISTAGWIVLPLLALITSFWVLARYARLKQKLDPAVAAFVHIYIYIAVFMIIMTIRENRLLEFAHFASQLVPWFFLVFGLTVFKVPDAWRTPKLGLLIALWCVICVDLLSPFEFYRLVLGYGLVPLYAAGLIGITVRFLSYQNTLAWITCVSLLATVSFGFAASYPGLAWNTQYNAIESTRRVAQAVTKIENRLPTDVYPSFWINNNDDKFTGEYRAIMCSFVAHSLSMYTYPKVEPGRVFRSGTFLVLITQNKDVFESANEKMSEAGMSLAFYAQDPVAEGGVTYWLTYVRVLSAGSPQSGLETAPQTPR